MYIILIIAGLMSDKKHAHLRKSGTLNPHPERVSDPLFSNSSFFDSRDLLQVRYEMIRAHTSATTLKEIAARFGVSVATCVRLKRDYREGGLQALVPGRRGPQGPHKITPEMLDFAENYRAVHGRTSVRKLAALINKEFEAHIHFSGLHRALSNRNS